MSTTEEAAKIRAAYKALGWTSRDVSVRAHYYSMGSSIYVTIKSPKVDGDKAKEIAESAESIRRDGFGEILGGGNRYVSVDYSRECREAMAAKWLPAVEAALVKLQAADQNTLIEVDGVPGFMIGRDGSAWLRLWLHDELGRNASPNDPAGIAFEAELFVRRCAKKAVAA